VYARRRTADFCDPLLPPSVISKTVPAEGRPDRMSCGLYRKSGTLYCYIHSSATYGYNVGRDLSDDRRDVAAERHQQMSLTVTTSEFEETRFERFSGNAVGIRMFPFPLPKSNVTTRVLLYCAMAIRDPPTPRSLGNQILFYILYSVD